MERLKFYAEFARRCLGLLAEERAFFAWFIGLSVLTTLSEGMSISLLVPVLQQQGTEQMFEGIPFLGKVGEFFPPSDRAASLRLAATCLLVVIILRGALTYLVQVFATIVPYRMRQRISQRCFDALLHVDVQFIGRKDAGDLLNQISTLPTRVSQLLISFGDVIWNVMIASLYLIFMMAISWQITLLVLTFLGVLSLGIRRFSSARVGRLGAELTAANAQVSGVTLETLSGMRVIRLMVGEGLISRRFGRAFDGLTAAQQSLQNANVLPGPVLNTGAGILICIMLFIAASSGDDGAGKHVSQILLFIFLMFRLLAPISSLNASRLRIVGDLNALDITESFLEDCRRHRAPSGTRPMIRLDSKVAFEDVSFTYMGADKPTLENLSFEIGRGEMVAVVGPSGAGKSTLASLVAGFLQPSGGRIVIDGVDMRDYDIADWRRRLAMVSQDVVVFDDTVANNIGFGRDLPRSRIEQAAELAAADGFIKNLPQGYDTVLGDRGTRLSGGERQRIAIARAIAGAPDMLVLDEATSNLDSLTEAAIQHTVQELRPERALLVIAHRLSTLYSADRILVVHAGRIIEQGTHAELLAQGGLYASMVHQQQFQADRATPLEGASERLERE